MANGANYSLFAIRHSLYPVAMSETKQTANEDRRTLILTGASRGIGHATVKRFSSAGWRVITCSRHAFPEN
ncbi:MAG TPA: SDR family NAD(P)-dependent oxidoreductase, partial [Rhizomicrobium sp.]|nr:SDR family NAD(P)-dependent oxidoreductase [Rhizomicrobium sp.]